MKKKFRIISRILTLLLAITVALFIYQSRTVDFEEGTVEIAPLDTLQPEPIIEFGLLADSFDIVRGEVQRNEFLSNILLKYNVPYVEIDALAKASREVFDVRKIAVGKPYTILQRRDSSAKAEYFIYQPNAIDYVIYHLGDSISIKMEQKPVEIVEKTMGGVINSSLYESLQENGGSPSLAIELAEVYAWSIDFYRIQKGDYFKVVYEEKMVDGEVIGIGKVKAAQFHHFNDDFYGYFFETEDGGDYYDENAKSLRKAFLKSPLKFSRLSSRYTQRRFHPVQKRWKAHLGTDYAAPTGTPIMSTGTGVVIESAYSRFNGNYVKVKHNSVYTTQYLHMSKRNVKVGQRVRQGDILGYVGSTGLATGPHVCYRFWKNGKQVDHLAEKFPPAKPIEESHKAAFLAFQTAMNAKLVKVQLNKKPKPEQLSASK